MRRPRAVLVLLAPALLGAVLAAGYGAGCARRLEPAPAQPSGSVARSAARPPAIASEATRAPGPAPVSFAGAAPGVTGRPLPGPSVGAVDEIVELKGALFAAVNPAVAYRSGGVFRSDDGGVRWRRASQGLPRGERHRPETHALGGYRSVTALGVVGGTLLAGVRELEVYRSLDAGATWTPAVQQPERPTGSPPGGFRIERFAVLPNIVIASTNAGSFVSSDAGSSWTRKILWKNQNGMEGRFESLLAERGVLYATTQDGVLVSYDEGQHFTLHRLPHVPADLAARRGAVYVSFQDPAVPVYESRDRGRSWRATPIGDRPWERLTLALHGLSLAKPSAEQDRLVSGTLGTALVSLELGRRGLVFGTHNGVWVSNDRGASLRPSEAGLCADAIVQLAVSENRLFARVKEQRAGLLWSERAAPSWKNAASGGSDISALLVRGSEVLAGDYWSGDLSRSQDEGRSWGKVALPPVPQGPVQFVSAHGDQRLVVRGAILWSADAGRSWTDLSRGVPVEPEVIGPSRATAETTRYPVSSAVVTEQAVLLGAESGVLRRARDQAWSVVRFSEPVVALAYDAGVVYAATATTLFASRDEGRSFAAIAAGFGPSSGLAIAELGAARGELLVVAKRPVPRAAGDSFRILHTRDSGRTWQVVSEHMDQLPTSAPVAGPGGWYVGLASDGIWFLPTAVQEAPPG